MTPFVRKATVGILTFMLIGLLTGVQVFADSGLCAVDERGLFTAGAQSATDSAPPWSSAGRQIQLTGKVLCTGCTLEEARKAHPNVPDIRLYEVHSAQVSMVTALHWINNPRWQDGLRTPHLVRLRVDNALLQSILRQEHWARKLQVTGLLSHMGILYVSDMQVCN